MSLLSYFLYKTGAPNKFQSVSKYPIIDGVKRSDLKIGDDCECKSFEMGHKIYSNGTYILYETILSNGKQIVRNHLSSHTQDGNVVELKTYFGNNDIYDSTLDVCYVVDLINEVLSVEHNNFWDEILIDTNDTNDTNDDANANANTNSLNISVDTCISGFLISKDQQYTPKKNGYNGKIICDILGPDLEICYVDYLKYQNMNVLIYCQKYDIEQELINNNNNNNINKSASEIAKKKIVGHCIMLTNDGNLNEQYMAKVVVNAMNFNQKKYEEKQKMDLLKMYATAYTIQNPKK